MPDVLNADSHAVSLPDVVHDGGVVLPALEVGEAAGGRDQLTVRAGVEKLVVSPHLPCLTDLSRR